MSKYFLEIQNRLILLILTWFSTMLVSYFYKETLLFIIIQPNTFINVNEHLAFFYFIFTDVTEILSVYLKLIVFLSSQIFFIYLIYHFFLFLSPALFQFEYLYFRFSIQCMSFLLLFSAVLVTYFLIPFTWNFFLSFQDLTSTRSFNIYFEAKLNEYLCFYIKLYYFCGFYCQFFVFFLLFLNYIDVNRKFIKKFRKFYHYCFIIFSTLISPPEILSQIFISLIIIFIYEFLLLFFLFKICLKSLI
jgi:sec-independent protein translocase protein TatC